jgi:hypothetical protein
VRAGARHAIFIINGTKPHAIHARRVKFLRFMWHGRIVFRRSVWHPGTKPRPFLDDMAKVMDPIFHERMRQMVSGVTDRFNR